MNETFVESKIPEIREIENSQRENPVDENTETGTLQEEVTYADEAESSITKNTDDTQEYSFIHLMDGESMSDDTNCWIIDNFIERGSVTLIKAESGIGLTWLLSALSLSVAQQLDDSDVKKVEGRDLVFSHFRKNKAVNVTYCDGSSNAQALAERIIALKDKEIKIDRKINLLCLNGKDLSFNNEETRLKLENNLRDDDSHLIIFDSLSTLFGIDIAKKGESEENLRFQMLNWLKNLRAKKATMIFVACQSEKNCFRLPESYIDNVIKLIKVQNFTSTEMRIEFLKSRNLDKQASIPFRLLLEKSGKDDSKVRLIYQDDPFYYISRVHELSKLGIPQSKIAKELGCNQSTISRWLAKSLPEQPQIR